MMAGDLAALAGDLAGVARQFGLGRPLRSELLPGGRAGVAKLTTTRGSFVVRPPPPPGRIEAELYERVAHTLSAAGILQARPLRTTDGSLIGSRGHVVHEFLPGTICMHPTTAQTTAVMVHLTAYHASLAQLPAPAALRTSGTVWARAASAEWLVRELPALLAKAGAPPEWRETTASAVTRLAQGLPLIRALPRQLIHGDIGPDNVLMSGDDVVAIIDFTPHDQPFLFAVATATYWYHVYGRDRPDLAGMRTSLAAVARQHDWTAAEVAAWPAMLLREALRRLATTLAIAAEAGTGLPPAAGTGLPATAGTGLPPTAGRRYLAARAVLGSWSEIGATPRVISVDSQADPPENRPSSENRPR